MIRKKVIAGTMAAMLMAAAALPGMAAGNQATIVTYGQSASYQLSIPENVTLKDEAVQSTITVKAINLEPNTVVQLSVTEGVSEGRVSLSRTGDTETTVYSNVSVNDGNVEVGAILAEFGTVADSVDLNFSAIASTTGDEIKAGTYTGSITFASEIVPETGSETGSETVPETGSETVPE